MITRISNVLSETSKVLLGRKTAGRNLTVFPDDIFLTSYPRSGNTWTRFLIGNLFHQDEPVTFANVEALVPEIYLFPDRILRSFARPRLLKSHESFDPRYKRVIYIVRDPRDVAVSYYHYAIKRNSIPDGFPIEEFIPRFISAELDRQWGWAASWGDHVLSWTRMRQGRPGFVLLRYEDMLSDTKAGLAKVAHFLELDPTPERLTRAVELSSADRMRKLEKTEGQQWKLTQDTRKDKPFVRSAKSGDWKSTLPEKCVAAIEDAWAPIMLSLSYELVTQKATVQV